MAQSPGRERFGGRLFGLGVRRESGQHGLLLLMDVGRGVKFDECTASGVTGGFGPEFES